MPKYVCADPHRPVAFPIARPGYFLIGAAAFITLVLALLKLTIPSLFGLCITIFICYFFRDPDRATPDDETALVSPADGTILLVETLDSNPFFDGPCRKISIFMSLFNVHVNRIPFDGEVDEIRYIPGDFLAADRPEASMRNEHNAVVITTPTHEKICFVQVAGLIARRIICHLSVKDTVRKGQRFGMICFGSRLDVYAPKELIPQVNKGDKVKSGASILGFLPHSKSASLS